VENSAILRRKMSNPKCPFCATEASKHEAGRCLDHWVYAVKHGYAIRFETTHDHDPTYQTECPDYQVIFIKNTQVGTKRDGKLTLFSSEWPSQVLRYSDIDDAMTLWDDDWILHNYMEGEVLVWAIWDKVVARRSMFDGSSRHIPIAEAKDPATAICRAFLITNLKGENDA